MNQRIILVVGHSYSGKTTWAKQFIKNNPSYTYICADEIRGELSPINDESDQSHNVKIFLVIIPKRIKQTVDSGKSCLLDLTAVSRKARKSMIGWAKESNLPIDCYYFIPNLSLAKERYGLRDRKVPMNIVEDQIKRWEEPKLEEGFEVLMNLSNSL